MATFRGSSNENSDDARSEPVCLIRPFKPSDSEEIKNLVGEAAMETVGDYYTRAFLSTLTPQLCFAGFAVGFLVFKWPFYGCASLVPVPMILLYLFIWVAHFMKAMELREDASNISNSYMTQPDTNFLVAEVFDNVLSNELSAHFNATKKVDYDFITEKNLGPEDLSKKFKYRTIVGCVGISKSNYISNKAWIKRLVVQKVYRRRNIATHLLEEAISFCKERKYNGIDLSATDCHYQAISLFSKYGFTSVMTTRGFFGITQQQTVFSIKIQDKSDVPFDTMNGATIRV